MIIESSYQAFSLYDFMSHRTTYYKNYYNNYYKNYYKKYYNNYYKKLFNYMDCLI